MGTVIHTIENREDGEFIKRVFQGEVIVEEIMDSFVYILKNRMISKGCKGILTDLRDAVLKLDMVLFQKLLIYIKSNQQLTGLKIAVVVDSSEKIVFPMMASNDPGLYVQPFSTLEAAERWILQ